MEIQTLPEPVEKPPPVDYHSNVDSSRPFSSVKEAVAVFGERFLTGEIYSHKPSFTFPKQEYSPWKYSSSALSSTPVSKQTSWESISQPRGNDHDPTLVTSTLKKLEAELEQTKMELKLLKERESETEVALASLNAELHKNMSKIAQAEAAEAARAVATRSSTAIGGNGRRDMIVRMESTSPTLAQILSITGGGEKDPSLFGEKTKKESRKNMKKKKPIIPLVGDLFSRKKGSSTTLHNPLFSSSHLFWN